MKQIILVEDSDWLTQNFKHATGLLQKGTPITLLAHRGTNPTVVLIFVEIKNI